MILTGKQIQDARRPILYIWKRGEQWLYVGYSGWGVGRVYTSVRVGEEHPLLDTDTVEVVDAADVSSARELERQLILDHRPLYNKIPRGSHSL